MKIDVTMTATVVANFAWQHLKAATLFRDHVLRLEVENAGEQMGTFFEGIRSYASACIMSSAASLEALINELFIAPNGGLRPMMPDFEKEFWGNGGVERKPILDKYQLALSMLNVAALDERAPPYRDAWALIELRNALVHYKPTWDPDRRRKVELVEVLKGKFLTSPFLDLDLGADFVSMKCMSGACCGWAVATAITFLKQFDASARLDPHKMSAFWKLGGS